MPKKSDIPLQKHTLLLYEGDFDKLKSYYPEIDGGLIVRRLVRTHIEQIEAPTKGQALPKIKVEVP